MSERLANKVAIITGGAGGIGRATARLFLDEGASVLLVDRDTPALARTAAELDHSRLHTHPADVTSAADTRAYVQAAVERFGRVDIMFANAGIEGRVGDPWDYPDESFEAVMDVNVKGSYLSVKHAMAAMRAANHGGSIVITSSVAGVLGSAKLLAYSVSKHAVIGLMRSAALAGAAHGIRVNTINPAPIETRMMRSIEAQTEPNDPAHAKALRLARQPTGRYGSPEEVGRLVLFLASDESSYCTGGVYMIDGALTAY